ncbi:MAG: DUF4349 domain-containing protein [Oscillospiraceae bacterium]
MKTKAIISAALCALILTACGSSMNDKSAASIAYDNGASYESYSYDEYSYSDEEYVEVNEEAASSNVLSDGSEADSTLSADKIKTEMLVYTCNMTVDVLNFDEAIGKFKESLESYGGFVETENYSDGGSDSRWYYEDADKWQSYSATVRVPSADYENFCAAAAELGDLRSKNASVENVSSEYYDLSTTLEIYEAKEERYIALLADITSDEYAVAVERELTDLQVDIAKIKTRMNEIRTDVAYSFVNIRINEVKEYTAEPVQTDTFGQRLMNTLSETGEGFLDFLEWALFALIAMFPYLILIGIIVLIVIAIRKNIKKKKALKKAEKAVSGMISEASEENKTE